MSRAKFRERFPWRHLWLLLALLVLFILGPLATRRGYGIVLLNILGATVILLALAAVGEGHRRFFVAISGLAVLSVALTFLVPFIHNEVAVILSQTCALLLLSSFAFAILGYVLRPGPVTADKIFAAVCVYLLVGYAWAFAFALVEDISPGSFAGIEQGGSLIDDFAQRVIQFRYFSFVTLTTVGYGDILPKSAEARTLASLEAVMGQFYMAVLVARLVGLHIVYSTEKKG